MIQITPHMRILLAVAPVDFRKGIDGLAALCRSVLKSDPFSGCMFVFLNRQKTSIKILCYDGQGFWICQKRLSKGRLIGGLKMRMMISPLWMPMNSRCWFGTVILPKPGQLPCGGKSQYNFFVQDSFFTYVQA